MKGSALMDMAGCHTDASSWPTPRARVNYSRWLLGASDPGSGAYVLGPGLYCWGNDAAVRGTDRLQAEWRGERESVRKPIREFEEAAWTSLLMDGEQPERQHP